MAGRWDQSPAEAAAQAAKEQQTADVIAGLQASPGAHTVEILASHGGQPSIAVQDATHGVGLPAEDRGGR